MKLKIRPDEDPEMSFELALDLLCRKYNIPRECRTVTLIDDTIYDIPNDIWELTSFQHDLLKITLKYK